MKKLILVLCAVTASLSLKAQAEKPAASPLSHLEQKVGFTDMELEYSRPSMKGRAIFGTLVPYNKLWRTGANAYTTISFSTDVTIAGTAVKAGKYSIFTKPGASNWEVFFYAESEGRGTPKEWDASKIVATASVPVSAMTMNVETFTITVDDLKDDSAKLGFAWEKSYVAVSITVPGK